MYCQAAITLQAVIRGILARKLKQKRKQNIIKFQSIVRRFIGRYCCKGSRITLCRRKYRLWMEKALILQSLLRTREVQLQIAPLSTEMKLILLTIYAGKMIERRKHIANEILDTERSYVDCLTTCDEIFQQPLLAGGIPKDTCILLFANLTQIIGIHFQLLKTLEARFVVFFLVIYWSPHNF